MNSSTNSELAEQIAVERLCEIRKPIRYIHGASGDFSIPMILEPVSSRQKLTTQALVDSGCTGSAINKAYIEKYSLDMKKALIPIPVYNADGIRNQGGDITKFIELSMMISEHCEHIDLAMTNLGKKDVYLGHDWLKCHNPSVNWEHGMIIFGRCDCMGERLILPNADPDNCWDKELEEGDSILAVRMEEELIIRAIHHANDLTATAHAEKPKKMFEEMVPEHYHSFRDLFSKENFDELPERKPWDHTIELVPNADGVYPVMSTDYVSCLARLVFLHSFIPSSVVDYLSNSPFDSYHHLSPNNSQDEASL